MTDITLTLSSPAVALSAGTGTLAITVTNVSTTVQRVVLAAYPEGRDSAAPTYATVDRSLRSIAAGGTEQYIVAFDTTGAAPGSYADKFIAYSADRAPEDYADQGAVVTLTVPAAAVAAKKRFPWWAVAVAVVLVLAIGGAALFLTRPKEVSTNLAWVPGGPADATSAAPDTWYAPLQKKDCGALKGASPDGDPLWKSMSALCFATVDKKASAAVKASAWAAAKSGLGPLTRPAAADCLNRAAYNVLKSFVAFHDKNPDLTPSVIPAKGFACPLGITALSPAGSFLPSPVVSGPIAGGTVVRLVGRLEDPVVVTLGTVTYDAVKISENRFEFTTKAVATATPVKVTVMSDGKAAEGSAIFNYVQPADPGGPIVDFCVNQPKFCQVYIREKLILGFDPNTITEVPGMGG